MNEPEKMKLAQSGENPAYDWLHVQRAENDQVLYVKYRKCMIILCSTQVIEKVVLKYQAHL